MFVGREYELKQLQKSWKQKKAQLIVCTGRRRIGKSKLISEFSKTANNFIEISGLAPAPKITNDRQLANFAEILGLQTRTPAMKLNNWNEAFWALDDRISRLKGTTVVLLDEISWMASRDPDFAGKLKIAWDMKFSRQKNIVLVLCGSVSSWINANILQNTDFVGRITLALDVTELPVGVLGGFWKNHLKNTGTAEILKFISVTGGVPRYLEELDPASSAEDNIHRLCFTKGSLLLLEFEKIFNEIFDQRANTYRQIVKNLACGKKSFAQVCRAIKKPRSGIILSYLEDLRKSGFIERDFNHKPDGKTSKTSYYRIKDNYLRFYLRYIEPVLPKIESGIYRQKSLELLPEWDVIMGLQFENIVLNNLKLVIESIGLDPNTIISASPHFQARTTKNKGSCQLDLLINTKNGVYYLCEFKNRKNIGTEVIRDVAKKAAVFKRPKFTSIKPVLIYCGNLSENVLQKDYFAHVINVESWVKPAG